MAQTVPQDINTKTRQAHTNLTQKSLIYHSSENEDAHGRQPAYYTIK
jgi:hypothetical protein